MQEQNMTMNIKFLTQFQHSTILKTPSDTQNTANNKNYYEHNVQDDILEQEQ